MDVLTQGLAGALVAQAHAEDKQEIRLATGLGFFAGLLADADILIRSADDPLINLEYHRQFSHSLLFIPIGGLIAALLIGWFVRKRLSAAHIYLYCLMGYASAGVLDACTSFGTQLLWPVLDTRIAWNIISVVDPVFTTGVIIALVVAWKTRRRSITVLGIAFAALYLFMGWMQHERAEALALSLIEARGHQAQRHVVKPTLGNIMLWRSVYYANGNYYVDAVRPALFGEDRFYTGDSIPAFLPVKSELVDRHGPVQFKDIERFGTLSNNYLVMHPDEPDVIGDIRYAMLPDSIRPLWGIRIESGRSTEHVKEYLGRKRDKATLDRFKDMVLGN